MLLFIYGTLKRAARNAHYMAGQRFISEARTMARYRLADFGDHPGMFPVEADGRSIHGEVWEVDEACRAKLDVLEDVAGGEYELARVSLLAPFDGPDIATYLHRRATVDMPDAGEEWKDQ